MSVSAPAKRGLLALILTVTLNPGCTEKLVAPDRTPFTYEVYAGDGLIDVESPLYIGWTEEPVYLGQSDTTTSFDLGGADSVEFLTITMNLNIERHLREEVGSLPGEVWIDAIRDLQTGKYLGADADGTVHGFFWISFLEVYDVLDTQTGQLSAEPSVQYLVGPPDGRYVVLKNYDISYIVVTSLDGQPTRNVVLTDGPGPDLEVFARPVPTHLQTSPRHRAAPGEREVVRMRPASSDGAR